MDKTVDKIPESSEKLSAKFILDALRFGRGSCLEDACPQLAPFPLSGPSPQSDTLNPRISESSLKRLLIPNGKKYFRMGEVAEILQVEPYVIRYWESEFSVIKPSKSTSGHRVYARRDVEALLQVRRLLYEEKFSISGARIKLKEKRAEAVAQLKEPSVSIHHQCLKQVAKGLRELIDLARSNPGSS